MSLNSLQYTYTYVHIYIFKLYIYVHMYIQYTYKGICIFNAQWGQMFDVMVNALDGD